jgi:hypothetical protein
MSGKAADGAQANTESAAAAGAAGAAVADKGAAGAGAAENKGAAAGAEAGKETPAGKGAADDAAGKAGAAGEEGKGSKAGDTPKVPDKYSLAIPDDAKEFVDGDVLKSVETLARESGWSNEDAQNAVNEHATMLKRANESYLAQLKADADYGGEKLAETQRLAKAAIDLVRPEGHARREAFIRAINRVAAGNHPEFVSFLADIGKRAAEDQPSQSSGARRGEKTVEETLYGGTAAKK